jgi:hypothetical protein
MEQQNVTLKTIATKKLKHAKNELYREELRSALYASLVGVCMYRGYLSFFSGWTVMWFVLGFYLLGFFRPTIKNQIYLGNIINSLKNSMDVMDNPPVQDVPKKPWKTN